MKKQTPLFFAILVTFFTLRTASAQGEWKWANYWSGTDGNGYSNRTVQAAFDEDGNIYVFGEIGGQPTLNGQTLQFTSHPYAFNIGKRSSMLAKFDSLGNMLWYKMVKSSDQIYCLPHWMEVKDNKVYISGNMSLDYVDYSATVNNVWLYYFDTLITGPQVHEIPVEQRRPPYKTGRYTYFATFDLDGNLLDNHFVETRTRIYSDGSRGEYGLVANYILAPFHVDREGNTYVFTNIQYAGSVNDPYTIIVDSDTNRTYDVYLPGDVAPSYGYPLDNGMMYKFSPDWELLYARPMVDHTEGIATSHELAQDSINPHYYIHIGGLSFDEDDNMYFTGYLELGLSGGFGDTLHQYPVHIYWDSTHYCSMLDVTSARAMGFVVKYDTGGTVQWCNQTFTRGDNQFSAYAGFTGVKVYDGSVYVNGQGGVIHEEQNGLVYFDDESHPLQRYQQSRSNQTFFVRYDAQTGNYLNQGVAPCIDAMCGSFLTVINNRVFAYADPLYVQKICQWTNNGEFIDTIDFNTYEDKYPSVLANDQGRLIFHSRVTGPAAFSNSVSANCPGGRSSAVFALYSDPSFAEPYVGISEYDGPKPEVRLWPNPAIERITIESEEEFPIVSVAVADMQGTILTLLPVNDVRCTLNVHNLAPGTYIAHVRTKAGISDVKFVVVSR
ncbi:MAG: T9SS type A sorting domain-containing protein [Bacteroidales bacterium]|nr:T9SS type A sorting domain-containing protein [Bacteroidales bacterium]